MTIATCLAVRVERWPFLHVGICRVIQVSLSRKEKDVVSDLVSNAERKLSAWAWHCVHSQNAKFISANKKQWFSYETTQYNSCQHYPPYSINTVLSIIVQPLTMKNSLLALEGIHRCGSQRVTADNQLTVIPKGRNMPSLGSWPTLDAGRDLRKGIFPHL